MYLFGYLEFVFLLLLPGVAFLEASQLGRKISLAERLGVALGMGMAIDVLIMLAWVYGGAGAAYSFLAAVIIIASIGVTLSRVVKGRRLSFYVSPTRADVLVSVLVLVQGLLVFAHYYKYPIFPEFASIDFSQHVMLVSSLARSPPSPVDAVLYYGVHVLMLELAGLTGGAPFVMTQRMMDVLLVLSPLLVYAAASAVSESKPISLAATFIYVAGGFVWFGSVFNAGLYPNFYGILSTLFVIAAASMIIKEPSNLGSWMVYLVSFANALFSHYTTLLIFPALVALPILRFIIMKKLDRRMAAIAMVPILSAVATLGLFPGLLNTLEGFLISQSGTSVGGSTPLSQSLTWYPFASFLAAEITSDPATASIFIMAMVGTYVTIRKGSTLLLIPLLWFITIAVVSTGANAWRFSYAALMPLCFLAAIGFDPVFARMTEERGKVRPRRYNRKFTQNPKFVLVGSVVLLLLLVWGSWGTQVVADALDQGGIYGQAQRDVYASMLWFRSNTPSDSKILSITDWRYSYTGLVVGRAAGYSPLAPPEGVVQQVQQLKGASDVYVALTAVATVPQSSENPIQAYSNNPHFQLVYTNADVRIYLVKVNSTA